MTGFKDLQECSGSQQARFGNLANELSGDREGGEGGKDGRWEEVGRCQSSKEEARIHSLCYWGRFYGRRPQFFNSFNFLSLNNKKSGTFTSLKIGLGACCLTILILLRVLNVLRGRCDHATPTFAEFKV